MVVTKDSTLMMEGNGSKQDIAERCDQLRSLIKQTSSGGGLYWPFGCLCSRPLLCACQYMVVLLVCKCRRVVPAFRVFIVLVATLTLLGGGVRCSRSRAQYF